MKQRCKNCGRIWCGPPDSRPWLAFAWQVITLPRGAWHYYFACRTAEGSGEKGASE